LLFNENDTQVGLNKHCKQCLWQQRKLNTKTVSFSGPSCTVNIIHQ